MSQFITFANRHLLILLIGVLGICVFSAYREGVMYDSGFLVSLTVTTMASAGFRKFWSGAHKMRQCPLLCIWEQWSSFPSVNPGIENCTFSYFPWNQVMSNWKLYFHVITLKFLCVFAWLSLCLLGVLHYDAHSCPGNVCPPHRWHIWHSSCCSLTLCWWRCSPSPACKSGLLSFISSPMPLRKSGRWVVPSIFVFSTSRKRRFGLMMKMDRWVKGGGETGNADPDLPAIGRVFRGKFLISTLNSCQRLSAGRCSLKAVTFQDVPVCLSVL